MLDDTFADQMEYDSAKMTIDLGRFKMLRFYTAYNTVITGTHSSRAVKWSATRTTHRPPDELITLWKEKCPCLTQVVINDNWWTWSGHLGWTWKRL
ncbi:hypothetical protein FRB94_003843 [Tulasnella sp. JGI-2019a]|nr:hypothetical protein FRB94_003843 [Tulasnella sp. JGI-2019a]